MWTRLKNLQKILSAPEFGAVFIIYFVVVVIAALTLTALTTGPVSWLLAGIALVHGLYAVISYDDLRTFYANERERFQRLRFEAWQRRVEQQNPESRLYLDQLAFDIPGLDEEA